MSADSNVAPIIIKRKKSGGGDGHHGGAWKVAYADFVTAMMAFFLLMWLLNATTEKQRKGIADYFSPTVPLSKVSGGGDGAFGGTDVFSEEVLPQNGTGATDRKPTESQAARGIEGSDGVGREDEAFRAVEETLMGLGGESQVTSNALKHVVTRVTDEGLVIELFALEGAPLFAPDTDQPMPVMQDLATMLGRVFDLVGNDVAVAGYVASRPVVVENNPVWDLSASRADMVRRLLVDAQVRDGRLQRVTGHADRKPVVADPMAARNNRIEVTLLRSDI